MSLTSEEIFPAVSAEDNSDQEATCLERGLKDCSELPHKEIQGEDDELHADVIPADNSQAQLQTFFQNLTIEACTSRPGHFAIADNNVHGRESSESSQSATEAVPNARSAADSVVEGPGSDSATTSPREASRFSCCLATSFDPTLLRAPTRARQLSMVASDNLPFQEDWPNALELCESDTRAEALSIAKTLALTGASHSEASC